MKLVLHYFRNYTHLLLTNEEFRVLRTQLISKAINMSDKSILENLRRRGEVYKRTQTDQMTKTQLYPEIWESEIYRLRGEIFLEAKNNDKANEAFLQSIVLCHTKYKNWISLAFSAERFIQMACDRHEHGSSILSWVCTAIEGYLKALNYKLFNSKLYIAKILDLVSTYAKIDTEKRILNIFKEQFQK